MASLPELGALGDSQRALETGTIRLGRTHAMARCGKDGARGAKLTRGTLAGTVGASRPRLLNPVQLKSHPVRPAAPITFHARFFCGCLNRSGVRYTMFLGPVKKGISSWRFISVLPASGLFWLREP